MSATTKAEIQLNEVLVGVRRLPLNLLHLVKEAVDYRVKMERVLLSELTFKTPEGPAPACQRIVQMGDKVLGEFVTDISGWAYYFPAEPQQGGFSEEILRQLHLKLSEVNAAWDKQTDEYFFSHLLCPGPPHLSGGYDTLWSSEVPKEISDECKADAVVGEGSGDLSSRQASPIQ